MGGCDAPECNEYRQTNQKILNDQGRELSYAGKYAVRAGALCFLGDGIGKFAGKLLGRIIRFFGSKDISIKFGRNANQIYHTFRHVKAVGLDREAVEAAVRRDLAPITDGMVPEKVLNREIDVNGISVTYSAYKLPDGTINVGRITTQ